MPDPILVRKAAAGDEAAIDRILVRAFDSDPIVNWIVQAGAHRLERVKTLMMAAHRLGAGHGEVYITSEQTGAALWFSPQDSPTLLENFKLMVALAQVTPPPHLPTVLKGLSSLKLRHPTYPHFFLYILAVEPEYQGRGIGSALMQPVLAQCDQEGIPAYLENSKEQNLALYERNGFQTIEAFAAPKNGPTVWLMVRQPGV